MNMEQTKEELDLISRLELANKEFMEYMAGMSYNSNITSTRMGNITSVCEKYGLSFHCFVRSPDYLKDMNDDVYKTMLEKFVIQYIGDTLSGEFDDDL